MKNEKFENTSQFEKQTENLSLEYLEKGRDFDVVHTQYGLEVLKENEENLDEDIYKILFFSFAMHDIGYSLLDEAPRGYENIKKQKQAHAILGSQEVERILSKEDVFNSEEKEIIKDLILQHDEVEKVVDYKYKDFEIGRYLMSLDTLGSFMAIKNGKATFTKEELEKYLKKAVERRGTRIHSMLESLFEESVLEIERINNSL